MIAKEAREKICAKLNEVFDEKGDGFLCICSFSNENIRLTSDEEKKLEKILEVLDLLN